MVASLPVFLSKTSKINNIDQKLLLSIKAELENVTDLMPADDDFDWFFKVAFDPMSFRSTTNTISGEM